MLVALHANHSSSTGNDPPDQIDEQLQRESDNGTQHNGTDQARDGALEEGTEGSVVRGGEEGGIITVLLISLLLMYHILDHWHNCTLH